MKHILTKVKVGDELAFVVSDSTGKILGLITKPKDTRADKNAWRSFRGIGEGQTFLGHSWSKSDAVGVVCGTVAPLVSPRLPS